MSKGFYWRIRPQPLAAMQGLLRKMLKEDPALGGDYLMAAVAAKPLVPAVEKRRQKSRPRRRPKAKKFELKEGKWQR